MRIQCRTRLVLLLTGLMSFSGLAPVGAATLSRDCNGSAGVGARLPVMLVHGFNSGPSTWSEKTRETIGSDTTSTCIAIFDYSRWSTHWVTDRHIAKALATELLLLANASQRAGGPGKVVIVAHSMGGLAARCAADKACSGVDGVASRIRALITFGTPNLGTYLKGFGVGTRVGDYVAPYIGTLCSGSGNALSLLSGACNGGRALTTSDAAKAFTPGSAQLVALPKFRDSIPVMAVAGSVQIRSSFWGRATVIGDVGDLLVSEDSALAASRVVGGVGGDNVVDCGVIDVQLTRANAAMAGMRCSHISETNNHAFLDQVMRTLRAIKKADSPARVDPMMFLGDITGRTGVNFDSPDHNIICGIYQLDQNDDPKTTMNFGCYIQRHTYVEPPDTKNCGEHMTWGGGLDVPFAGPTEVLCRSQAIFGGEIRPASILPYESSITYENVTCRSALSGMFCRNMVNGKGFTLSSNSFSIF
jgi:pimeloyl-ACP methyl ester carboxylesterase